MNHTITKILLAITLGCGGVALSGQALADTPTQASSEQDRQARIAFTNVYIDYVCSIHKIRETFSTDLKENHSPNNIFLAGIKLDTRVLLAADNNVQQLENIRISRASMKEFPGLLKSMIEEKIAQTKEASEFSEEALNVDTSDLKKATAEITKIRTRLAKFSVFDEELDKTIFNFVKAAFMVLEDIEKPNSKNNIDRLIVTKAERKDLSTKITSCFGSSINQKKQDWMVSSASVLNAGLNNKFKSSDDQ